MNARNEQKETIEIIEAKLEHVENAAILFDMYRQFYQQQSDLPGARAFLTERLAEQTSVIFLARLRQASVGFMQLYPTYSSLSLKQLWILSDLFVHPDARGKGVGKLLLQQARQLAASTLAEGLTLQTAKDNVIAQSLYESQGWEQETVFLTYNLLLPL